MSEIVAILIKPRQGKLPLVELQLANGESIIRQGRWIGRKHRYKTANGRWLERKTKMTFIHKGKFHVIDVEYPWT